MSLSMVAPRGALGLDQSVMDRLKQIGPSCWSADMGKCRAGDNPSYPHCAELQQIDENNPDEFAEWADTVPWCELCFEGPATQARGELAACSTILPAGYIGLAIAAGGGIAVGLALGYALFS